MPVASLRDLYRRVRRPYRVKWADLGPPRLQPEGAAMNKSFHRYGSLVDRVTRIFFSMSPEQVDRVLQKYREEYGDGAYAYAKRTIGAWKQGQVKQVGQTVMRLLEVVPQFVDLQTKFELARIVREETLRRLHQYRIEYTIPADGDLSDPMTRLQEIIDAQLAIELPPGVLEDHTWLSREDAALFQRMIRDTERVELAAWYRDFFARVRLLQRMRLETPFRAKIVAYFELPTARVSLRIVEPRKRRTMSQEHISSDDSAFLAKWSDLELESRFKSGDVSYPAYVLRNMDQFFTEEEQAELNKIAAMHGLELERLLMEIQIKQRTSEADLQKLIATIKSLQEKNIAADVVSRHETPSGHIEISARSRRLLGCLPIGSVFLGLFAYALSLLF